MTQDEKTGLSGWPLLILSGIIGGVSGVLAVLVSRWMTLYGGLDSPDKHGISSVRACRLGGVLVFSYLFFFNIDHYWRLRELMVSGIGVWLLALGTLFFMIGLFEDMKGTLSAKLRLGLMIAAVALILVLNRDLVIQPVGIRFIDWFMTQPWLAVPITLVSLVFLPNAFNVADGANGLVGGISLIVCVALGHTMLGDLNLLLDIVSVGCLIFLAYNLLTGKVFLGDGGAYFLGALVGGATIVASNIGDLPFWYLLSLIFYPVADFLWSIGRRMLLRQSPMVADELHLHNLLYALFQQLLSTQVRANTMTGLCIALVFSGLPYITWLLTNDSQLDWKWVFLLQWVVYACLWLTLRPKAVAVSLLNPE